MNENELAILIDQVDAVWTKVNLCTDINLKFIIYFKMIIFMLKFTLRSLFFATQTYRFFRFIFKNWLIHLKKSY